MPEPGIERILTHMNNDHKLALYDYLRYYGGVKLNPGLGETVELVDVSTTDITLNFRLGKVLKTKKIPLNPPLKNLGELRTRLISMAYESAEAFGYSAAPIKTIRPPNFWGYLTAALMGIATVLSFSPNLSLRLIGSRLPSIALFLKTHIRKALLLTVIIHIFEYYFIMRPKLNKFRVRGSLRFKYKVSAFVEGAPAWHRLVDDIEKLENVRKQKLN